MLPTAFLRRAAAALLAGACALPAALATNVRLHTNVGPIDIELFDATAPNTVANFLAYVRAGRYTDSVVHRSDAGVGIIQGGGYTWAAGSSSLGYVPKFAPIALEYSDSRPNVRGTIAMARTINVDSATSQWFFNLKDNTTSLGSANGGGYAVFGRVTTPSLAVIDAIHALQVKNLGSTFTTFPVLSWNGTQTAPTRDQAVRVTAAQEMPARETLSDSDRIFNYLEAAFPQHAAPSGAVTGQAQGYVYRYYAATNAYVGTKDGQVHYLVPALSPQIQTLGTVAQWLATAQAAGY